jgi:hypothetical protein
MFIQSHHANFSFPDSVRLFPKMHIFFFYWYILNCSSEGYHDTLIHAHNVHWSYSPVLLFFIFFITKTNPVIFCSPVILVSISITYCFSLTFLNYCKYFHEGYKYNYKTKQIIKILFYQIFNLKCILILYVTFVISQI